VFESLKGRLLVATPDLGDPNFFRCVVLMLEHTPDGAVGVILNRPTETGLGEAATDWEGWDELAAPPAVVFVGGPVSQTAVICVASRSGDGPVPDPDEEAEVEGFQPVSGSLGVADLRRPPDSVEAVRIFAGYSGWGGGQLEGELAAGAWFVLDALPEDALGDDPDELWARVLRRQGGRLALFAACPPDPTLN
jgi:putative transcriptional regulator